MTTAKTIRALFANDIGRKIEEVIKVDQTADDVLKEELEEYVVTDAIRRHYTEVYEAYAEAPKKPTEGIAVWVSGFFGSGKSSFAKMLGLSISNRTVGGKPSAKVFGERVGDKKLQVLLGTIAEKVPTHAVIFDVSTDRGIRSGNQTLTEIMYGLFLQSLGYAKELDLSELEIGLEEKGELAKFEEEYRRLFKKEWAAGKGMTAFALSEASRVLHSLHPETYSAPDSWVKAAKNRADITPGKLAERVKELMERRRPGQSLAFVVDEVGQFVARDVQKMLDLQAVVQSLGRVGRGKHWVVVTSQEKLGELVSGLDDNKIELARLMDRFPLQVHLEPSDISEVTSRRVLAKNAAAEKELGSLFDEHRARLGQHTRLTAEIRLPELSREAFVALYPLLPYQIDLIIQIVSGLRTQGGASRHVGGANRTIIKLAQQLLINPAVNLADAKVGALVQLDRVYDLVEGNIGSEVRSKISAIPKELHHPMAQSVAKAVCLLQYVKSVHRSAENIAAALHPSVVGDSQLASVKEALQELERAQKVRQGDDGYRIPTPAEDDWEKTRNGINPKPGDSHRLYSEVLSAFWQPQPSHTLFDTKTFKAGLAIHGKEVTSGDMAFQVHLAEDGKALDVLKADLRKRSQEERKHAFWAVGLTDAIDHEAVEVFRSKEILARKERETRGEDTPALIAEERQRLKRHSGELRRLFSAACLSGAIYFQGKDRGPNADAKEVGKAAEETLRQVLPEVFDRFKEAAAKPAEVKKGWEALFTAESLEGLPSVFSALELLRDEMGKTVFCVESGPLQEVQSRIEDRAKYGETPSGRYLADELAKEPFGWDFEVVRLLVLSLVRAGKIEATSKGTTIDGLKGSLARDTFTNNNHFRQASFRPKKGIEFKELLAAAEAFKDTFGREMKELTSAAITVELRKEIDSSEAAVAEALSTLREHRLPGDAVLEEAIGHMRGILRGSEDGAIATFNASHTAIKGAIRRAAELAQALTEPSLRDLERARRALGQQWKFLEGEADVSDELRGRAKVLGDLLERETFFKELPAIEQNATAIGAEYERRFDAALAARAEAYGYALDVLKATPGWTELDGGRRQELAASFERLGRRESNGASIPELRADLAACDGRLQAAVMEVRRIIDGERVVTVKLGKYFAAGIENEEQLERAIEGIREECSRLIGAGKKIIVP